MLKINIAAIEEFHQFNDEAKKKCQDKDPITKKLAEHYLDSLASKSGNDILEKVFVEATFRKVKAIKQKHGADSEDGELEAKPMKCGYNAHISDDTPNILINQHKIPYIVIGEATEDGQRIKYVILTDFRKFDEKRFQKLVMQLPETERKHFNILPFDPNERITVLNKLSEIWANKKQKGIRSNSLPFDVIKSLNPGEYIIWINPDETVQEEMSNTFFKELQKLEKQQTSFTNTSHSLNCKSAAFNKSVGLESKTKKELEEMCRKNKISGFSGKNKKDLIVMLTKYLNSSESKMSPPQTDV
jgi:hypothetical protein